MGLHLARFGHRRSYAIEMGGDILKVGISGTLSSPRITTELGVPRFDTKAVPMKSRRHYHINAPIKIGGQIFPITCLSVGNPHAVLFVDSFDFDWPSLGKEIEHHRVFPERINVEFVKVISQRKLKVCDWERGAGATGSSGTGASAAVCAGVMLGAVERTCSVDFPGGTLHVHWRESDDRIVITGPVKYVFSGEYEFK